MSKQICSVCKQEQNGRSLQSCDNCKKPMCAECYAKYNGNCGCQSVITNSLVDII